MLVSFARLALCFGWIGMACAQVPAGSEQQRQQFLRAWHAAQHGTAGAWQREAQGLERYPLYPYLAYAALTRDLDKAKPEEVARFLDEQAGSLLADRLRRSWLVRLARKQRWQEYLVHWQPQEDAALRCHWLWARIHLQKASPEAEVRALWLSAQSLPAACDPALRWFRQAGHLRPVLVWQRIELAARARNAALMRQLAPLLPGLARSEALGYAQLVADPQRALPQAARWADTARSRRYIARALADLARRDAPAAGAQWPLLSKRFAFNAAQRHRVVAAIALYHAASYRPEAAQWFAQLPLAAGDEQAREWRVREALARADYTAALRAAAGLSDTQKQDPRWRYVRARLLELNGQPAAARALYAALSGEANFHGFLAADRLHRAYAICPLAADPAVSQQAAHAASLTRALELHALGWYPQARSEWQHATQGASTAQRAAAVALAHRQGWIDRGPLTLLLPAETRYYALRFPLGHRAEVLQGAQRHRLDPAWVFGLIRSESAWHAQALSTAQARGLTQIIPGTALLLARKEKIKYDGPHDLFRPAVAITLGTRHMRDELDRYRDRLWLATAAYNAGPSPVQRWLAARPNLPSDLWVETIPYRETREYVTRVLAFTVIYDWRLHGRVTRLSQRLDLPAGRGNQALVQCPAASAAQAGPAAAP